MLQSRAARPFVCWRCFAHSRLRAIPAAQPGAALRLSATGGKIEAAKFFSGAAVSRALANVSDVNSNSTSNGQPTTSPSPEDDIPDWLPVRERLKAWDQANPQSQMPDIRDFLYAVHPRASKNNVTKNESSQLNEMEKDPEEDGELDAEHYSEFDENFQPMSIVMQPGDLIEARSGSARSPLLAVFICQRDGYSHFYASNGTWYARRQPKTNFVVPGFATQAEMAPVKARLPPPGTPEAKIDELSAGNDGPTREDGQVLLRKMADFLEEIDTALQANHHKLDDPYSVLAVLGRELITAREAAEFLLDDKARDADGEFSPAAVYAVQRAMENCEFGLCVAEAAVLNLKGSLFEILKPEDVESIKAVEKMVRELYADPQALGEGPAAEQHLLRHRLGYFIVRARRQIDRNRGERSFSAQSSVLGPYRSRIADPETTAQTATPVAESWLLTEDREIMNFMTLWAAKLAFGPESRANTFAAHILRATRRYGDCEFLDTSLGWLFLQEVGWILPWDIQARHRRAVPGTTPSRAGGLADNPGPLPAKALEKDAYPGTRRDWGNQRAFAIDAVETRDIDDAVSVERTSTPGQYWIHVHVSDVASFIRPNTAYARHAERLSETMYLPGHYTRMLPDETILEHVSLGSGARALTFSGLVNDEGALLKYEITPGVLRNVVNITPDEVSKICPEPAQYYGLDAPPVTMRVGPPLSEQTAVPEGKAVVTAEQLDAQDVQDLKLLDRLAAGLRARREANLAYPRQKERLDRALRPRFSTAATRISQGIDGTFRTSGDATIEVSDRAGIAVASHLVEACMLLAGEIAGRWCDERGIPVPYRTMPQATLNKDALESWVRGYLYPKNTSDVPLTEDDYRHTAKLVGPTVLSTTPGRHFFLGLDHYVKATSPLRRYLDLVVHWQIHGALADEFRTGNKLQRPPRGEDHGCLPFRRADLDARLPLLAVRENKARALSTNRKQAHLEYIYQAVARAWHFGEAALPPTLTMRVRGVLSGKRVCGVLDELWSLSAFLLAADVNGVVESHAMLARDDVVEVRLKHVDPARQQIFVEAVRLLSSGASDRST